MAKYWGLFEHERLKLANVRTSQGNVQNLAQLKQVINVGLKIWKFEFHKRKYYYSTYLTL